MVSVTKRIATVSQPRNGFVPCSIFTTNRFEDYNEIFDIRSNLYSIQGMAVDYLTRFVITGDKEAAFSISIKGAKKIDEIYESNKETNKINKLLSDITGLDKKSVIATCKAVCYDVAFRAGIDKYISHEEIEFTEDLFRNIPVLVKRSIAFFDSIGGIKSTEITFEGGYTNLVSSGDGDYLSSNMIIDLKTSKNDLSPKWTLQLLMYYLMGLHSIHEEYHNIQYLCVFNPIKNESYTCNIADISDESKYKVSHDVIGYKMVNDCCHFDKNWNAIYDYSKWEEIDGTDNKILKDFINATFVETDFKVSNYGDGIFDITIDDYWTYLKSFEEYKFSSRPLFKYTQSVKLIKNSGYFMFISVSPKGKYGLLHGAKVHSLKYSLEYYYDFMEKYSMGIISRFSKYWDALRNISEQVKKLEPTEKFLRLKYAEYLGLQEFLQTPKNRRLSYNAWYDTMGYAYHPSGKIHGCIVDIDYYNHIYVNPLDGTITPYYAISMYDKNVYKNVRSLLSAQKPELLQSFDAMISSTEEQTALMSQNGKNENLSIISGDDEINMDFVKVYEHDMYGISKKLKPLQNIYDYKWIQIWYDEVLGDNLQLEEKHLIKSKKSTEKKRHLTEDIYTPFLQKNGLSVIVVRYGNYRDVDVSFEDGTVIEHVRMKSVRKGTIKHPDLDKPQKKEKIPSHTVRDRYIGASKLMHCGMKATCVDYIDCKHLSVLFEDGMMKDNVSSTQFNNGTIEHEGGYYP